MEGVVVTTAICCCCCYCHEVNFGRWSGIGIRTREGWSGGCYCWKRMVGFGGRRI